MRTNISHTFKTLVLENLVVTDDCFGLQNEALKVLVESEVLAKHNSGVQFEHDGNETIVYKVEGGCYMGCVSSQIFRFKTNLGDVLELPLDVECHITTDEEGYPEYVEIDKIHSTKESEKILEEYLKTEFQYVEIGPVNSNSLQFYNDAIYYFNFTGINIEELNKLPKVKDINDAYHNLKDYKIRKSATKAKLVANDILDKFLTNGFDVAISSEGGSQNIKVTANYDTIDNKLIKSVIEFTKEPFVLDIEVNEEIVFVGNKHFGLKFGTYTTAKELYPIVMRELGTYFITKDELISESIDHIKNCLVIRTERVRNNCRYFTIYVESVGGRTAEVKVNTDNKVLTKKEFLDDKTFRSVLFNTLNIWY